MRRWRSPTGTGFAARARPKPAQRGKLRGIGVANYVEITGGAPRERAEITIAPEGRVELVIGTMSAARGTRPVSRSSSPNGSACRSTASTTSHTIPTRVSAGGGSHSGRSMRLASLAIGKASDAIIEKGRKIAAHPARGERQSTSNSTRGAFAVKGTDRAIGIFEVAAAAATRNDLPTELQGQLDGIADQTCRSRAFPPARMSARSRSIPRPARCEIVGYAASTMSGARSIR